MKRKTYIAVYSAIAFAVIIATVFQVYSTGKASDSMDITTTLKEETYDKDLVQTIEGTDTDMLVPEFWIRDRKDEVLFTSAEIENFNNNNPDYVEYYSEESLRNLKIFMDDMPESISGEDVRALIDSEAQAVIPDEVTPQYAICVERSVAKSLPSDEFVSDDPDEIFFNDLISAEVMPFTGVVVLCESADGNWDYIINGSYCGWVKKETLAICKDKEEWLRISNPDNFLVVTGSEIVMDETAVPTSSSGMILPMGTRIILLDEGSADSDETVNGRSLICAYHVEIPYRDADGNVQLEETLVPVSKDVNVGYLTMTSESVITQAFKFLGRVYGYGGTLSSNDCSGFIRQVYSCYGFRLPRNAKAIAERSDLGSIDCTNMTVDKKKSILAKMTPGLLLYMDGHIMMYLGTEEGMPYVISSCATCIEPGHEKEDIVDAYCVFVSGLDLVRASGDTWLEDISYILWKEY